MREKAKSGMISRIPAFKTGRGSCFLFNYKRKRKSTTFNAKC